MNSKQKKKRAQYRNQVKRDNRLLREAESRRLKAEKEAEQQAIELARTEALITKITLTHLPNMSSCSGGQWGSEQYACILVRVATEYAEEDLTTVVGLKTDSIEKKLDAVERYFLRFCSGRTLSDVEGMFKHEVSYSDCT